MTVRQRAEPALAGRSAAVVDHIAVAVPSLGPGRALWQAAYGGGLASRTAQETFGTEQYVYAGGGRLELIAPGPNGTAAQLSSFLAKFGEAVHHLTVKVADLDAAITAIEKIGMAVTGVDRSGRHWHEAYVSPRLTGLPVIQLAWTDQALAQAAARQGVTMAEPREDAGRLLGMWCRHADPLAHLALWRALGADVIVRGRSVECLWRGAPLRVWVTPAARPRPAKVLVQGMARAGRPVAVVREIPDQVGAPDIATYLTTSIDPADSAE